MRQKMEYHIVTKRQFMAQEVRIIVDYEQPSESGSEKASGWRFNIETSKRKYWDISVYISKNSKRRRGTPYGLSKSHGMASRRLLRATKKAYESEQTNEAFSNNN